MSWIERWNKRRLGMKKKVVGKIVPEEEEVVGETASEEEKVVGEIVLGDNWVGSDEGEEMDEL